MNSAQLLQNEMEDAAEAPGHFFNGQRLQPFSFSRQTCFERCFGDVESDFESKIAIVFICTLGEELAEKPLSGIDLIESARGKNGVRAFRNRVAVWADQLGLTANNPEGVEAAKIGWKIWQESKKSKFKAVTSGGGDADPNG